MGRGDNVSPEKWPLTDMTKPQNSKHPPTPKMPRVAKELCPFLCQATDHIPTGAAQRRVETAVPLSRCSHMKQGCSPAQSL